MNTMDIRVTKESSVYNINIPTWLYMASLRHISYEQYNTHHVNGSAIFKVEVQTLFEEDYRNLRISVSSCDNEEKHVQAFIKRILNSTGGEVISHKINWM